MVFRVPPVIGGVVVVSLICVSSTSFAADDLRIAPSAPWAQALDDEMSKSAFELRYGVDPADLPQVEGYWVGNMYVGPDAGTRLQLEEQGVDPPRAVNYEPTPGVLYLAMDGVTIESNCPNGDSANGALNCSPLVSMAPGGTVNFPPYSGNQEAMQQTLQGYYQDFDLVLTNNRPPSYLQYTMAVIGGSAGMAGQGGGVCGIANVACDGLKRNHVSLTFPNSCGSVADIAAQETSHNWGLEHVNVQSDLMYPFANGGFKTFNDQCMTVDHSTSEEPVTVCDYIHEEYCPAGAGEEQNSHAELMAAFGPRNPDSVSPEIVSISPENGTEFTSDDTFVVSAQVTEDSNFLGAQWTWLEGFPDELDGFTRCTNNTCNEDYNYGTGFDPNTAEWDFVRLEMPPAGTYSFRFEVMDAYGNSDMEEITITVVPGASTSAETGDDEGDEEGDTADGDNGNGDGIDDGDGDGTSGGDESGSGDAGADGGGGDKGCGCTSAPSHLPVFFGLLILCVPALRRRR